MSLINNMLKDLEKRQHASSQKPYLAVANQSRHYTYSKQSLIILISVLVIVASLAASLMIHKKTAAHHVSQVLPTEMQQKKMVSSANNDVNWLKPVSITGVTMQTKDNITELTFLLNHPALYRLTSEDMVNQVSLTIDNAELRSELPANTLSGAIQHISTQKINEDAVFKLTLYPGVAVKYVNLSTESKNPELVIAFENRLAVQPQDSSSNSNVLKTPAMRDVLKKQYQQALSAATNGHYQLAINDLTSVIKMDPEYNDARVSLIAILMNQGNMHKANKLLNDGLQLSPDNLALIELKARLLAGEGKNREALNLLESATPSFDDNPEYFALIAALYGRSNNDLLAAQLYRKLLAINSNNGSWWFGLGVSLDKLGRTQEAVEAYTSAAAQGQLDAPSVAYLQKRLSTLQELRDEKG